MSSINDLLTQVTDHILKAKLEAEINKLTKNKKFGLVFEDHLPERTPLYDIPVKKGSLVAKKTGKISDVYRVLKINGGVAECERKGSSEKESFPVVNLVSVAEFGEPIYPCLKPIDSVCNGPEDGPWHTLIEADNYHALQLLEYLYAGKVDCIYIDPPYNTGARDWKYNNDYVDGNDAYRHSKWLSMMQKRLKLAKKLLNPKDSVLIVTIDEKEYLHLGCLLEEMFPEARMQMVSTIIKPEGTNRMNEFSRTNEYIYFLMFGEVELKPSVNNMFCTDSDELEKQNSDEQRELEWRNLRRRGNASVRSSRPNQFFPIFVNQLSGLIDSIGEALPSDANRLDIPCPEGCYALYPLSPDGEETLWGKHYATTRELLKKGYLKISNGKKPEKAIVRYLPTGTVDDINSGKILLTGRGAQNEVLGHYVDKQKIVMPKTIWHLPSHNSQVNGSLLIKKLIGGNRFTFPKSLYAVADTIRFFVASKPNALVVDFFAGSGTTQHAVDLINAEDGGHRRCVMVTNNEVSAEEAKSLTNQGYQPGDPEWERLGIAHYVTWPRIVCSTKGKDINGNPLKGNYLGCDIPMADGFKSNTAFFKLGFLDKTSVALGRQFKEMLPTLWLKAGAFGACPDVDETLPAMMVLPQNKFAVLLDETAYPEFKKQVKDNATIQTVFIVTNSESGYREMITSFSDKATYQLYRDYLDNFRINTGR